MHWTVIGGSGGIGKAIVTTAVEKGGYVRFTGSSRASVQSLVKGLTGKKGVAKGTSIRLKGRVSLYRMLRFLRKQRAPDVLVFAYGPLVECELQQTKPDSWIQMALHNLAFPGAVVSGMLPRMLDRGTGTIILFGGTGTDVIRGYRRVAAYSAAKTGIGVLASSAAAAIQEYSNSHEECDVRVVCISPGFVDTEYLTDDKRERFSRLAGENGLESVSTYAELVWKIARREEKFENGAIIRAETYRL